jgi:hypothetical protein
VIASGNAEKHTLPTVIDFLEGSYRKLIHGDSLSNAVKHTYPTVIGLLKGSYRKLTDGDSLWECIKTHTTHGDRLFIGFLLQLDPW